MTELRLATMGDAEAIREIYNVEVTETTNTFDLEPRSLEQQRSWLSERLGALGVIVAEVDGRIAGFASLSEYRPRPAYRTTVESSVYVAGWARGEGVGRELMHELVDVATPPGQAVGRARPALARLLLAVIALRHRLGHEQLERRHHRPTSEHLRAAVGR